MSIVHHANRVRSTRSGVKVGGHQASSASIVSIMTALWFEHLRAPDRVSVKPHASPVLHAIEYLLGQLDRGLADHAARVRRPAELSEPTEGSGARRLLHRLGRDRRDRDRSGARSPIGTSPAISRSRRADATSRSWATPSSTRARLGGARRPGRAAPRARSCGSSTSTASRSTGSCPRSLPAGSRDVRGRRLADDHGQVRPVAARAVRAPGRRGAARSGSTR